jgi:GNAT superfamily N-acetyltransferase
LDYKLRNYQPGDEYQIVDLFNAAFGKTVVFTPRTVEFWIWRYLKKPGFDAKGVFLAEKEGTIISAVIETVRKARFGEKVLNLGVIDDVSTRPELWGRGLASKLLEESIKYAEQKKLDALTLYADPKEKAHRIYLKCGFKDVKLFNYYIKALNQEIPLNDKIKKERNQTIILEQLIQKNLQDFTEIYNMVHTRLEGFWPLSINDLRWRLLEPPKVFPSETWIAKRGEEIMGGGTLHVLKLKAFETEFNSAVLENIFTSKRNDTIAAKTILLKLLEKAKKKGCPLALTIISSDCDFESKLLESNGFTKIPNDDVQMVKCFSEFNFSSLTKRCWYAPYEHLLA